jgi:hypothetical protein
MKKILLYGLGILVVVAAAPTPVQAATPVELKRQVTHLKQTNRALRNQLRTEERRVSRVQAQGAALTAERDAAARERDQLLGGLPAAIEAVPLDQFLDSVLAPAYRRWTCHDKLTGSGFWTVSFHSRSLCG